MACFGSDCVETILRREEVVMKVAAGTAQGLFYPLNNTQKMLLQSTALVNKLICAFLALFGVVCLR